jgi:tetratricopeptide (TPR) repeat protein/transcriptional regulator with XRE-family HTH domain
VTEPSVRFSSVLRELRERAGLTQEELAEAAGLSTRTVSDLERDVVSMPQKETVRLLAAALALDGLPRIEFEAVARGRASHGAVRGVMRMLPRDITSFTGRLPELEDLQDAAISAARSPGTVAIRAIGGMPGVGKTALAIHAAHRLTSRFPGGQIFLSLHGHTPGRSPVRPADALGTLLLAIGVPAAQVPAGLEERAALWRDRVADRELLLVLDDVADTQQARPLLPGAGRSLVLLTSRRRLAALEDATAISLDTLPPDDAAALLIRLAARPALDAADPAVLEITRLCGFLPLAIGMLGRQLHHHPAWTAAGRAAELAAAVDRLELLATENVSVTAAFDLSYQDLAPELQRLFRRLSLHPGAEIDAPAAAALGGADVTGARRGLEALYDQHLLTEVAPGRYRMHDLLREHARALAERVDSADDRGDAIDRLLDYYQRTAARAHSLLCGTAGSVATAAADAIPAAVSGPADRDEALAWFRVERASLLACLELATGAGQHARVIALTAGIAELLRLDGPWAEAIPLHGAAVEAARHLRDQHGQAGALTDLSRARLLSGEHAAAARGLDGAMTIYRALGDRRGQAYTLIYLGILRRMTGDHAAAAVALQDALDIGRDLDDQHAQAECLNHLGKLSFVAGQYPAAARDLQEALRLYRNLGDRRGQADTQASLGYVWRLTGDYRAAERELRDALSTCRYLGDRRSQAHALIFLGDLRRLTGEHAAAAQDLQEALSIYRDLGSRGGQANALLYLGIVRRLTGDFPAAAKDGQEALEIYRDLRSRSGELEALNEAGTLSRLRGEMDQARAYHQQALELAREMGSPHDEAYALSGLGRCCRDSGCAGEAARWLEQALVILERLGVPEAAEVAAELSALRREHGSGRSARTPG